MKKRISFRNYLLSLGAVAIIFGLGGYFISQADNDESMPEKVTSSQSGDELEKVHNLYDSLNANYYKKVDKDKLIEGAMQGMTEALDDPYTTYLDKTESEALDQSLSDSFEGIGASLSIVDDFPQIAQAPIKGTPAQKAELKAKDFIIEVDGKSTQGKKLNDVVKTIRGKKGTTVALKIRRGDNEFEVTLTRDTIPLETVSGALDKDHKTVGAIQITSFGESTAKELKETIRDLRKDGAKSFLIDLRQNPGGLLDQVEQMASMFLKDGKTIVEFSDVEGTVSKAVASEKFDDGFKVDEPTVVLVDNGSASASEIFAAALKESAGIPVVGTNTFGKGTVQTVADLGDDSELKMTIMKWLTPKGEWINEKGLTPTIKADFPSYAYLPPLPRNKTLKLGQNSDDVEHLNQFLKALGYSTGGADYTDKTKSAVSELQKANKLKVTGEVDVETANLIESKVTEKIKNSDQAYQVGIKELTK